MIKTKVQTSYYVVEVTVSRLSRISIVCPVLFLLCALRCFHEGN